MAKMGAYNKLKVVKLLSFGAYLDGGNMGEILLPLRYIPEGLKPEDVIEVFLYTDSEDRPVATTEKPHAVAGEFAYLKTIEVTSNGAFLDWGLPKDLFVPFREQEPRMKEGNSYPVYVYVDPASGRPLASGRIEKFLRAGADGFSEGEKVSLFIYAKTETAYKAAVNSRSSGLLYKNEIFIPVKVGMTVQGYIRKIREDGKLDLRMTPEGYGRIEELASVLLANLKSSDGFLPVGDSSPPARIRDLLHVSKKDFKKAIGLLYKKGLVDPSAHTVKLRKK